MASEGASRGEQRMNTVLHEYHTDPIHQWG